jgi:hypothetical protein
MRSILFASIAALAIPACTQEIGTGTGGDDTGGGSGGGGGGGGGSGTGSADTGNVSMTVDQTTVSTALGMTTMLTYTAASMNGYTGTITVTPTVADAGGTAITGWTLTPDQTSVALTAGGTATIKLTAAVPTNEAELAPVVTMAFSDGTTSSKVTSDFTVANILTITLDAVGTGVHATWPLKNDPIHILKGATVTFHNGDVIAHEIHSGGGIKHESGPLPAGMDYTTTDVQAEADWYCHDHEGGGNTRAILVDN